jgi:hypothetical protein
MPQLLRSICAEAATAAALIAVATFAYGLFQSTLLLRNRTPGTSIHAVLPWPRASQVTNKGLVHLRRMNRAMVAFGASALVLLLCVWFLST